MWTLLFAAITTAALPVEAQTLRGQTISGELNALTPVVVIQTATGVQKLDPQSLLEVSFTGPAVAESTAPAPAVFITLRDGSTLQAASLQLTAGAASVQLPTSAPLILPAAQIAHVRYAGAADAYTQQFEEILDARHASDVLVVHTKSGLDFVEGIIGETSEEGVQFRFEGEDVLSVKWAKIAGMIFYASQANGPTATPQFIAMDRNGNRVFATTARLEDEDLIVTGAGGYELRQPAKQWDHLDYSLGKIQYLADLRPESTEWAPYIGALQPHPTVARFFRPKSNRSFWGGPLELDGELYRKGLAIHSRTELVYRLPEGYSMFEAVAGLDDRIALQGNVRLTILSDGKSLFSEEIDRSSGAVPLRFDISGANRLTILVDYGQGRDVSDHLNLCDARLVK